MKKITLLFLLFVAQYFVFQNCAYAHSIGRSSSYWTVGADMADVRWALSEREYQSLLAGSGLSQLDTDQTINFLQKIFKIEAVSGTCDLINPQVTTLPVGDVDLGFQLTCRPDNVSLEGLFAESLRHVHLAHIKLQTGQTVDTLITSDRDTFAISTEVGETSFVSNAVDYIKLGFLHILEGFDHLAFLVALLLIVRDVRSLFWVISGFTVGHSITLIFGSLNILAATPEIIEPLIAFSIAFTAWDAVISKSDQPYKPLFLGLLSVIVLFVIDQNINAQIPLIAWVGVLLLSGGVWMFALQGEEKSKKILPAVTIGFGLIHGFGFAGVLGDIGLPTDGKFTALLGFNVGVELGQLAFVAAMLTIASLGTLLSRNFANLMRLIISFAVVGLGLYWFAERVFLS
ncbi:HupE/UreJ family protein [Kordiimonas sp. SCSIO 12610]|uniref:HupE/UreJ family protein n=1 Tax=Kordiimonas sp. SCSIO 12610 TaxID=2829597 RepID=UPI002108C965|nr:HupE/UreJ family protein [Kordiimonas sp. SCSIO 12610]UTW55774.1 HupE/UreJ family protein [Kordiimonas sp. SCSIO 12610]